MSNLLDPDAPGALEMRVGAWLAFIGTAIILWPQKGLEPHPLPFPPSEATGPIAGYVVFGYPLLDVGCLFALYGALRYAVRRDR